MTDDTNKNLSSMTMDSISSDFSGKEDESISGSLQTSLISRSGAESCKIVRRTKLIMAAFPWLTEFFIFIRGSLKISDCFQKQLVTYMDKYLSYLQPEALQCSTRPNKAFYLAQSIIETLVLFKNINYEFELSEEYLTRLHHILSNYVDLELKGSLRGKETVAEITTRIILTLEAHTKPADNVNFMYVFLNMRRLQNGHRDILQLLFMRFLKPNLTPYEFCDKKFLVYLIVFKLWRNIETCKLGKIKVSELAEKFMKPSRSPSCNKRICRYLPQNVLQEDITNITFKILQNKFSVERLIKVLKNYNSDNDDESDIEDYDIVDLDNDEIMDLTNDDPVASIPQTTTSSTSNDMDKETPLPFPPIQPIPLIKLESPKVVECIDLTEEPNNKLNWLSELAARARNAVIVPQTIIPPIKFKELNCNEIIEIDDDDLIIESVSSEKDNNSLVLTGISENRNEKDTEDVLKISQSQPLTDTTNEIPALADDINVNNTALPKLSDDLENKENENIPTSKVIINTSSKVDTKITVADNINLKVISIIENCDKDASVELVSDSKISDINNKCALNSSEDVASDSNNLLNKNDSNIVLEAPQIPENSCDDKSATDVEQSEIIPEKNITNKEITPVLLSTELPIETSDSNLTVTVEKEIPLESVASDDIINIGNIDYARLNSQSSESSQDFVYETPVSDNVCISFNEVVMSSETSDSEISNQEENVCGNLFLPINEIEVNETSNNIYKENHLNTNEDPLAIDEGSSSSFTIKKNQYCNSKTNEASTQNSIIEDQHKKIDEIIENQSSDKPVVVTTNELFSYTKNLDNTQLANICHIEENSVVDKAFGAITSNGEQEILKNTEICKKVNIDNDTANQEKCEKSLNVPYQQKSNIDTSLNEISSKENVVFSMSFKKIIPEEQIKTAIVDTNVVFSVGSKVTLKPCPESKSLTKDILEDWSSKSDEEAGVGASSLIDLEDNDSEYDEFEPFHARTTPNAISEDFIQESAQKKQKMVEDFKSLTSHIEKESKNTKRIVNQVVFKEGIDEINDTKSFSKSVEQNVKNRKSTTFSEPLVSSMRMRQPNESTILEKKTYINPVINKSKRSYSALIASSQESNDSSYSQYPSKQISSNTYSNSESPTLDNKIARGIAAGSSSKQPNNPDNYGEYNNLHNCQRQINNNINNYNNHNNNLSTIGHVESTKKIYVQGCKLDLDFLAHYKNIFKSKVVISLTPDINKYAQQYLEMERMAARQKKIEHTKMNKFKLKEIMDLLKYRGKRKIRNKRLISDSSSCDSDNSESNSEPKVKFQNHVQFEDNVKEYNVISNDEDSCETDIDELKNDTEEIKTIQKHRKSVDNSNVNPNGMCNMNEITKPKVKARSKRKPRRMYTPRSRRRRNYKMDNYKSDNETDIKLKRKSFVPLCNLATIKNVDTYLNISITDNYNCLHLSTRERSINEDSLKSSEITENSEKITTKSTYEETLDKVHDIDILTIENINEEKDITSENNNKNNGEIFDSISKNCFMDKIDENADREINNQTLDSKIITANDEVLISEEDEEEESNSVIEKFFIENVEQHLEVNTFDDDIEEVIIETSTSDIMKECIVENEIDTSHNADQEYSATSTSDIIEDCFLNEEIIFENCNNVLEECNTTTLVTVEYNNLNDDGNDIAKIIKDNIEQSGMVSNNAEIIPAEKEIEIDTKLDKSSVNNLVENSAVISDEIKISDENVNKLLERLNGGINTENVEKNNSKKNVTGAVNTVVKRIPWKTSSGDEHDSNDGKLKEPLQVNIWHQSNINKYAYLKKSSCYKQLHMRLRKRKLSETSVNKINPEEEKLNRLLEKPIAKIHRASLCLDLPDEKIDATPPPTTIYRHCSIENISIITEDYMFSNMKAVRWNSDPEIFQFNSENKMSALKELGNIDYISKEMSKHFLFNKHSLASKIPNPKDAMDKVKNKKIKPAKKKLMKNKITKRNNHQNLVTPVRSKTKMYKKKKIFRTSIKKNNSTPFHKHNTVNLKDSYKKIIIDNTVNVLNDNRFPPKIISRSCSLDNIVSKPLDKQNILPKAIRRNSYPNCNNNNNYVMFRKSENIEVNNQIHKKESIVKPVKKMSIDEQCEKIISDAINYVEANNKNSITGDNSQTDMFTSNELKKKRIMIVITKLIKKKFESGEIKKEDLIHLDGENIYSIYATTITDNENGINNINNKLKANEIQKFEHPAKIEQFLYTLNAFIKNNSNKIHGKQCEVITAVLKDANSSEDESITDNIKSQQKEEQNDTRLTIEEMDSHVNNDKEWENISPIIQDTNISEDESTTDNFETYQKVEQIVSSLEVDEMISVVNNDKVINIIPAVMQNVNISAIEPTTDNSKTDQMVEQIDSSLGDVNKSKIIPAVILDTNILPNETTTDNVETHQEVEQNNRSVTVEEMISFVNREKLSKIIPVAMHEANISEDELTTDNFETHEKEEQIVSSLAVDEMIVNNDKEIKIIPPIIQDTNISEEEPSNDNFETHQKVEQITSSSAVDEIISVVNNDKEIKIIPAVIQEVNISADEQTTYSFETHQEIEQNNRSVTVEEMISFMNRDKLSKIIPAAMHEANISEDELTTDNFEKRRFDKLSKIIPAAMQEANISEHESSTDNFEIHQKEENKNKTTMEEMISFVNNNKLSKIIPAAMQEANISEDEPFSDNLESQQNKDIISLVNNNIADEIKNVSSKTIEPSSDKIIEKEILFSELSFETKNNKKIDIIKIDNTIEKLNGKNDQPGIIIFDRNQDVVYGRGLVTTKNNNYVATEIETKNIDKEILLNGVKNTVIFSNYNQKEIKTPLNLVVSNTLENNKEVNKINEVENKLPNVEQIVANGIPDNNSVTNLEVSQCTLNAIVETPKLNNVIIRKDCSTQIMNGTLKKRSRKRNVSKIYNKIDLTEENNTIKKTKIAPISFTLPNDTEIRTCSTITHTKDVIQNNHVNKFKINQNSSIITDNNNSSIEISKKNTYVPVAVNASTKVDPQETYKNKPQQNNFNVISSLIQREPVKMNNGIYNGGSRSNNNDVVPTTINEHLVNNYATYSNNVIINNHNAIQQQQLFNGHGSSSKKPKLSKNVHFDLNNLNFNKAHEQRNSIMNDNSSKTANKNVKSMLHNSVIRSQAEPSGTHIPNIDLTTDNVIVKHSYEVVQTEKYVVEAVPSQRKRRQSTSVYHINPALPKPPMLQPIVQAHTHTHQSPYPLFNKSVYSLNNILPNFEKVNNNHNHNNNRSTDSYDHGNNNRSHINNEFYETRTVQCDNQNFSINKNRKNTSDVVCGNNYGNCYNGNIINNNNNNNHDNNSCVNNITMTSTLRRVRTMNNYVELPFYEEAPLPANRQPHNYLNINKTSTFIPNHIYHTNNNNNNNNINNNNNNNINNNNINNINNNNINNNNIINPNVICASALSLVQKPSPTPVIPNTTSQKRRGRPRGSKNKPRQNTSLDLTQTQKSLKQEPHNKFPSPNPSALNNLNLSKFELPKAIHDVKYNSLPAYNNGFQEQEAAINKQIASSKVDPKKAPIQSICPNGRSNNLPDVSEDENLKFVIDTCMDTNDDNVYSAGGTDTICSHIVIPDVPANILLNNNKSQEFIESDDEPLINLRDKQQHVTPPSTVKPSRIPASMSPRNNKSVTSTIISPDPYNTFLSSAQRLSESPPTLVVTQDGKNDKRTYSKANCEQKIFVPPEIDMFISQDNINHDLEDHDDVDVNAGIVGTGNNHLHHQMPMGDFAFIDSIENSFKVQEDIFVNR